MPFVRRQRKYYKDGVEVPTDTVTDFGRTIYYKNIVATKYWKEVTTGSRELEYACYTMFGDANKCAYVPYPLGGNTVYRKDTTWSKASKSSELVLTDASSLFSTITEESVIYNNPLSGNQVCPRSYENDLYKDTTKTETIEGTPEDYTYTTEETTPVEVSADDDYDYTEFIPSTQFDNYEDINKLYQLARRKRVYYKDGTEVSEIKYYKDVVTTKYWKEITTGSKELEYACYTGLVMGGDATATYYVKYPLGTDDYLYNANKEIVTNTQSSWNQYLVSVTETTLVVVFWGNTYSLSRSSEGDLYKDTTTTTVVEGTPEDYTYTTEEATKVEVSADEDWDSVNYDSYEDRLISHTPTVQDEFTYRITHEQTATGTYTITLNKDCEGSLLFVGNGGGGGSSASSSYWRNSSGGSGACFQGRVSLPKGTYTLTIGTLGYGYFIADSTNMAGGANSTDSYLTDENGNELIRVGCGIRGTAIGQGGAGGTLKLGTLEVLETTKAVNGNTGEWNNQYGQGVQKFAKSAYDGTTSGYGAGTSSYYGGGNIYGVAGIFKLDIEHLDKGLRSY